MKDRRGFLKLLGIGAGAAAAGVLAIVAGTPAPAPRTIQDIEKVKPYIGPDGVPKGDYIKERPPVVPEAIKAPESVPPLIWYGDAIDMSEIDWDTNCFGNTSHTLTLGYVTCGSPHQLTTTGTYDHNLGGYYTCTSDPLV